MKTLASAVFRCPELRMSSPIEDLVIEAKAAGVADSYGFAEWACQIKGLFGDFQRMSHSYQEGCYDEAMGWWEIGNQA